MIRGSSTAALILRKKTTASLPSINRWSYVKAMYIIGRMTTCNRNLKWFIFALKLQRQDSFFYLSFDSNRTVKNAVHAKNSTLRWVDDRCAHQWTENTTVTDRKSAAVHVFDSNRTTSGFVTHCSQSNLNFSKVFALDVSQNWHNKTFWCCNSNRNVNIVAIDDFLLKKK